MTAMSVPKAPTFQPLYKQIKDLIMERIADGEWPPGTFIPSESALASSYSVSVGTLRKALDELVNDNIVVRRQGKGTAVATHDTDRTLFRFFNIVRQDGERMLPISRVFSRSRRKARAEERELLGLAEGAQVVRIRRTRELDGEAVLMEEIVVDAERFPGLEKQPEILPNTLYQLYQQHYGVSIAHADEQLTAVLATKDEAEHLGVAEGVPLIQIRRIARDYQGEPLELRTSRLCTTHYCYIAQV